jgi:spore maturation protein CgeB
MMRLSFYGSSLVSSYWNGAATYYRGLLASLAALGYRITFFEPDAYGRQEHRDIDSPDYARVVVYPASEAGLHEALAQGLDADVVVKASGVGVFDDALLLAVAHDTAPASLRLFWDVDAPATLAEVRATPDHILRDLLPRLDAVLTYGGGSPVVEAYRGFGARRCIPVYNGLDRSTHFPVAPDPRFEADLAFLGNRLPDREARVEEFFFKPARLLPGHRFLLGGSGWDDVGLPPNVRSIGHVASGDHNAFNATPLAVLNISRQSMADVGFSPATRVFEAAGAGACLITDFWQGIDMFFAPDRELLVARSGEEVAALLERLDQAEAAEIGARALQRARQAHDYRRRAEEVHLALQDLLCGARRQPAMELRA